MCDQNDWLVLTERQSAAEWAGPAWSMAPPESTSAPTPHLCAFPMGPSTSLSLPAHLPTLRGLGPLRPTDLVPLADEEVRWGGVGTDWLKVMHYVVARPQLSGGGVPRSAVSVS